MEQYLNTQAEHNLKLLDKINVDEKRNHRRITLDQLRTLKLELEEPIVAIGDQKLHSNANIFYTNQIRTITDELQRADFYNSVSTKRNFMRRLREKKI